MNVMADRSMNTVRLVTARGGSFKLHILKPDRLRSYADNDISTRGVLQTAHT